MSSRLHAAAGAAVALALGACGGRSPSLALAQGLNDPRVLAAEGGVVYWADGDGRIHRVGETTDPTPDLLAQGPPDPVGLAVSATHVFWATVDGGVYRVPLVGGGPEALAQDDPVTAGPVLDDDDVFWATAGHVAKVSQMGGAMQVIVGGRPGPMGIQVDRLRLYWAEAGVGGNVGGALLAMPKEGGPVSVLAEGLTGPTPVAIAGTDVLWLAGDAVDWVPGAGGSTGLVAGGQARARGLVADGDDAWWSVDAGDLVHSSVTAPDPKVVYAGAGTPKALAVDPFGVYWVEAGDGAGHGRVMMLRR